MVSISCCISKLSLQEMAFMISKNRQSLSESEKMTEAAETLDSVTTQLFLKSSSTQRSAQRLDKDVVLRRLRYHKTLNKVKNTFQAIRAPEDGGTVSDYNEKWLEQGDNFSFP
ncbi:unnamed protein product [Fraxinus pennsylvanica]|uniref:Uncharacterized protein n=1 Tax=Fraxinus pennsylvanica TaxID=56036 RepID=A0AAD2DFV9_9LAMI|nr:unnamed protein product [Fraxinus pennsylvanica]